MMRLWCLTCAERAANTVAVMNRHGELLPCLQCGGATFISQDEPPVKCPWVLTLYDRGFLGQLRIAADG